MHTPFDVELPNLTWQQMWRGSLFWGSIMPPLQGGDWRVPGLPNFGVSFYLCVHPLSQNYEIWLVINVGRVCILGQPCSHPKRAEFQSYGVLLYLCLHHLTQNDQIRHGDTYLCGGMCFRRSVRPLHLHKCFARFVSDSWVSCFSVITLSENRLPVCPKAGHWRHTTVNQTVPLGKVHELTWPATTFSWYRTVIHTNDPDDPLPLRWGQISRPVNQTRNTCYHWTKCHRTLNIQSTIHMKLSNLNSKSHKTNWLCNS